MDTALFLSGSGTLLAALPITLILPKAKRSARQLALSLTILSSLLLTILSLDIFIHDRTLDIYLYHVAPALEIAFHIDRLAAFFIFIIAAVSIAVALYSVNYVEHIASVPRRNLSVGLMNIFILSMVGVVAAANTFTLLLFWEVMSFSSFLLVLTDYEIAQTRKSAIFYFVMTQMSTAFLLFAFIVCYILTGTFDITPLDGASPFYESLVFVTLFVGFGIKAGVIPFHKWLPYAHSASPSNISALMSGVMIKVAIYGMVRYIVFVLDPEPWWGIMILVFGTISALLGVIYALKEHDIKKLLAYHSIENIGIIIIGIGLYLIFQNYGWGELAFLSLAGALFHTLNHALFKSLLFLTAGSVVSVTGTRNIEEMGGLMKTMPKTGALFLIGAVAISALPPLNGFVSELLIFQAFLQSFSVDGDSVRILMFIGLSLFALTSALAAACFVKAFGIVFLAMPRSERAKQAREVPLLMLIGPSILALLCVLFGVFSFQISRYLGFHLPIPNLMVVSVFLLINLGLVFGAMRLFASRQSRTAETWGCGLISQNPRMEYTASGFSQPILRVFQPIYRTRESVKKTFWDRHSVILKSGVAGISTFKLFEESIYMPVARAVQRISLAVSKRHDVDLDVYILYAFLAIVILILVMGWAL
ncbi:MAG: proton-conducting transporter membrane subunit [Dehalococcoidia bacterium]